MARIFLSYRRQDSPAMAGRIYDRLRAHFGGDAVFMDIDSIPFGVDFREHIDAGVGQCDLVLAVIGTKWAGETDAHRRLDDPGDFVRIELESALHRNLPVIPILIDRARMPGEADLPPSLAPLAYRNAIDLDQGRDFHPESACGRSLPSAFTPRPFNPSGIRSGQGGGRPFGFWERGRLARTRAAGATALSGSGMSHFRPRAV
ncbi:MAG: toll/interleukin-1 receptor domain-containing protein [Isosphaerales bacterium]